MSLAENPRIESPKKSIFDRFPSLKEVREKDRFPKNIFIIPDGNGRWAQAHKLAVMFGHEKGAQVMVDAFRDLSELGDYIPYVGAWGFSVDNLQRPKEEVDFLMKLFDQTITKLEPDLMQRNNRFIHIGKKEILYPHESLYKTLRRVEERTIGNTGQVVYIALGFGGRDQDLRIAQKIMDRARADLDLQITPEYYDSLKDGNGGIPSADLIIRSSGEHRLSDVGWLQGRGTELHFAKKHFPSFDTRDFVDAIVDFSKRERRFGSRPKRN